MVRRLVRFSFYVPTNYAHKYGIIYITYYDISSSTLNFYASANNMRHRHYVLRLSVRPSVCPMSICLSDVRLSVRCFLNHFIFKT